MALAHSGVALAIALGAVGLANGLMDVSMNAHAVEVERGYERPIMGAFHAYFSLGGLAAALVGGPLIAAEVDVLITLVAAYAAGILATLACARWVLSARPQRRERSRTAPRPPPPLGWSKHVLDLLAFALMLAEGVAGGWSTVHLNDSLGTSKATAAWAFGLFSGR